MITLGDLYYYGNRGLVRNQNTAFNYYQQAANLGNGVGEVALAGLLIKV